MENTMFMNETDLNEEWTDEGAEIFFSRLKDILHTQELKITFTKKDGTERVMHCTLEASKLPLQENTETNTKRKVSTDTMAVFDLEAKAWRSFTKKSVTCVDFTAHSS